jgi:hypothetical protein
MVDNKSKGLNVTKFEALRRMSTGLCLPTFGSCRLSSPSNSSTSSHERRQSMNFEMPPQSKLPLFKVNLIMKDKAEIALSPSKDEIMKEILRIFDYAIENIHNVHELDADLFPMCNLKSKEIFKIILDYEVLPNLDSCHVSKSLADEINKMKVILTDVINLSFDAPHTLAALYEEFRFISDQSEEEMIANFEASFTDDNLESKSVHVASKIAVEAMDEDEFDYEEHQNKKVATRSLRATKENEAEIVSSF